MRCPRASPAGQGEQAGAVEGVLPVTGLTGRLPDPFCNPQECEDPGQGPVSSEEGETLPGGEARLSTPPSPIMSPVEAPLGWKAGTEERRGTWDLEPGDSGQDAQMETRLDPLWSSVSPVVTS